MIRRFLFLVERSLFFAIGGWVAWVFPRTGVYAVISTPRESVYLLDGDAVMWRDSQGMEICRIAVESPPEEK